MVPTKTTDRIERSTPANMLLLAKRLDTTLEEPVIELLRTHGEPSVIKSTRNKLRKVYRDPSYKLPPEYVDESHENSVTEHIPDIKYPTDTLDHDPEHPEEYVDLHRNVPDVPDNPHT